MEENLEATFDATASILSNSKSHIWQMFNPSTFDVADIWELLIRFLFNAAVVTFIIHLLYYPKSRRRDYYFTFSLISVSVFFLIFLLGGVKLKVGFALGLFAIFGIIRYRTESMPVREMTYLFRHHSHFRDQCTCRPSAPGSGGQRLVYRMDMALRKHPLAEACGIKISVV